MSEADIFGLSRIFNIILDHEQTGTLRVQKDEKEAHIYFEKGKVKLVASPHKRSVLAEGLMRCEQIEKDVLDTIFAKQREKKKSLIAVLKDTSLPEKFKQDSFLGHICATQISEEIYEILTWPDVHCEFMENQLLENFFDPELISLPVALDPRALDLESARRQDEWKQIREALPSNKDIPYIAHGLKTSTSGEITRSFKVSQIKEAMPKEIPPTERSPEDDAKIVATLQPMLGELGNISDLLEKAQMKTPEEAMKLFVTLYKSNKVPIKKAKDLKRILMLLGIVRDVKNLKEMLDTIRVSQETIIEMFIQLANEDKVSIASPEDMQRILSIMAMVNGVKDLGEIVEHVRMPAFDAMKICAGLKETEKIVLKSAQELKQMAALDILQKDTAKCIKLYERMEELGLKNFDTMNWLSKAYENAGLSNKAVEKYRELGTLALDNKLYEDAVRCYKKVVQYAPEDLEAYERLVNAYNKSGQKEKAAEVSAVYARRVAVFDKRKAIMVLDEANKMYPTNPGNLELMASIYMEMKDKENAILTYDILANLMKRQKDVQHTLEAYKKILALDNTNIKAHLEVARGLINLDNIQEGVAQYKELGKLLIGYVKASPTNTEIADTLISVCEAVIKYEPTNIASREWLVDTYIVRKEEKTALNILRELLGLLQKEQDLGKLVSNLRKVVSMDPEDFRSWKMLADTLLAQNDRRGAIDEYMKLGLKTYEKADMRKAREAFEGILNIDQFNLTARYRRAEIFHNLNIRVRAVEEYKLVGYLAKSVNMISEAVQAFACVAELAPDKELWCFTEVAKLCESLKDYSKAVYYYKNYAIKSLAKGNYGEAAFACERVITLEPGDAEAQSMLQQAQAKITSVQKMLTP